MRHGRAIRLRGLIRGFISSRAANFATLTALTMPILLMFAAFAIDEGSLYAERRELQALADIGALTAAANIAEAETAAASVLSDNGKAGLLAARAADAMASKEQHPPEGMTVETGRYTPDPNIPAQERFVAGASSPNAVRVALRSVGTRYFAAQFMAAPPMSASAVASLDPQAAFSVGSRLARLDAGVLNALLGALTGSSISLSLMDYEALAKADVSLFGLLEALRTDAKMEAATFTELLDTQVTAGQLVSSLADLDDIAPLAKTALASLSRALAKGENPSISLSSLFDLGPNTPLNLAAGSFQIDPKVGVLEVLSAATLLSAATGRDQIRFDLNASAHGLAGASVTLAIGEPAQRSPWLRVGRAGEVVRTAQTRLFVELTLAGPKGLLGNALRLPLYFELASAEAKATGISCPAGDSEGFKVSIAARPGIVSLRIADPDTAALTDFSRAPALAPARIVTLPLVKVTGAALASVSDRNFTTLRFDADDIDARAVKRVTTTDFTQSLANSLLSSLQLDVDLVGLSLAPPAALRTTVANVLAAATPGIDAILNGLLGTLGVTLGEADIRVHGASCGRPVLVQ